MERIFLEVALKKNQLDNLMNRYHFQMADRAKLQAMYDAVMPLIEAKAFYLWNVPGLDMDLETYTAVFLTLGTGIDALQDLYLSRSHMSEAYMIECIGLELLSAAYEEYAGQMQKTSGKWAVRLHFIGDKYPFSVMDKIRQAMGEIEIRYNDQYIMTPNKSVAFFLEMGEPAEGEPAKAGDGLKKNQQMERTHRALCHVKLAHICEDCNNLDCEYRHKINHTYGYQRIFGGK